MNTAPVIEFEVIFKVDVKKKIENVKIRMWLLPEKMLICKICIKIFRNKQDEKNN